MNRRGVVYLMAAVLLVGILLTIMYTTTLPTTRDKAESEFARIASMSDFLHDFSTDVHRATHIAGFRSFIATEQYINEKGDFLTDPAPVFIEVFMNGTIDGDAYQIMTNSTFGEYLQRVNTEAKKIGILLNATITNITLNQSTPWSVDITFEMEINVIS